MPRRRTHYNPSAPYHIGSRSNNGDWFDLPMPIVWKIFENQLFFFKHAFDVQIFSFVLMSNHYHLLAQFPKNNQSKALTYFLRETSRDIGRFSDRVNHMFGSRYYRSEIASDHYFNHAYKYLYRNPIRANLVTRAEQYPYSTLGCLLGQFKTIIPVTEDKMLFTNTEQILRWIHQAPPAEHTEAVRRALRRQQFGFSICRKTGYRHELTTQPY